MLLYDAVSNKIVYTFVSTPDQVLGDLMAAWGTPSGYERSDQAL